MSADNGVYVLQTKSPDGPEYRVTYAQAIDNIFGKFNDETLHWEPNNDVIQQYFGKSSVFTTLEEALDFAEKIAYNHEYLEDGVCVLMDFADYRFPDTQD